MSTFPIQPLSRFEATRTSIKRPRHFLEFSSNSKREIQPMSDASLRYYYPAFIETPGARPPAVDLATGFDRWERSDESIDHHLDGLLRTLLEHERRLLDKGSPPRHVKTKADVVTWRGMMTKILTAPFDIFSDFEMNATSYHDTIFIEENHAYSLADKHDQNQRRPRPGEASQEMMQYWGYKFETLSVLRRPWAEVGRDEIDNRTHDTVNNNEQYCSIVQTGIGGTSLILAGEVDCVLGERPEEPEAPVPWVELKTTAEPRGDHPRETQKFERKLLKFWAQSFLLGVPKIVVGFRTPDGCLSRIQEFETQKLPGQVQRGAGTWNGNVCINFTAALLEFFRREIMGTDGVWRIRRRKGDHEISIFKVEESGTGNILTSEFKAHRDRLFAAEIAAKLGGLTSTEETDTVGTSGL